MLLAQTRGLLPLVLFVAGGLAACSGGGSSAPAEDDATEELAQADDAISAEWYAKTWQVAVCDPEVLGAFQQNQGWISLAMKRQLQDSVSSLGPAGGLAAGRAHMEAASLFRQAALLDAWSIIQTYSDSRKPTDPDGVEHLLSVSYALVGDLDKAREHSAKVAAEDPSATWHAPWAAMLADGGVWPPDLSSLPMELPEPAAGSWPEAGSLPHYTLVEKSEEARELAVADPAALVALALWHDAAAQEAAGEQASLVAAWGARYRLPVEATPAPPAGEVPNELLFGSDYLTSGDIAFVNDLMGEDGAGAVQAHETDSLLAHLAAGARVDGKLNVEKALDAAADLREGLLEQMSAASGEPQDFHRPFADMGRVGALRVLGLVAEIEGDRETSGRLFITAYESSEDHTADPTALLALAAWDAHNRFPMRATEIVHSQARRYPSLEVARFGLDRLSLRIQFDKGPSDPGM